MMPNPPKVPKSFKLNTSLITSLMTQIAQRNLMMVDQVVLVDQAVMVKKKRRKMLNQLKQELEEP